MMIFHGHAPICMIQSNNKLLKKEDAIIRRPLSAQEQIVLSNDRCFQTPSVHLHRIHHLS